MQLSFLQTRVNARINHRLLLQHQNGRAHPSSSRSNINCSIRAEAGLATIWAAFPATQERQLTEDGWRLGGDAQWKMAGGIQPSQSKDICRHFNQTRKQRLVPGWESEGECANYQGRWKILDQQKRLWVLVLLGGGPSVAAVLFLGL